MSSFLNGDGAPEGWELPPAEHLAQEQLSEPQHRGRKIAAVALAAALVAGGAIFALRNAYAPADSVGSVDPTEQTFPDVTPIPETTTTTTEVVTTTTEAEVLQEENERKLLFEAIPRTSNEALSFAEALAPRLQAFAAQGESPTIMLESQEGVDLENGIDHSVLDTYFSKLQTLGITHETLGTVVPYPEHNIPEWGNDELTHPGAFVENYTAAVKSMRKFIPNGRSGLLLNNVSYPDASWDPIIELNADGSEKLQTRLNGLLEYTNGLPPGSVDELHFQGFTWADEYEPSVFLNGQAAVEVAKALGVNDIVFNTGTFSEMVDEFGNTIDTMTVEQRQEALNKVLVEVQKAKDAGLNVTVNIFAENKIGVEANWAYETPDEKAVLDAFIAEVTKRGMTVMLFTGQ